MPKSIYFNLKYFGIPGIILPVILSPRVVLKSTSGEIYIASKIKHGMIKMGFHNVSISTNWDRSIWNVHGKVNFEGCAIFGSGSKIFVNNNANIYFGDNFYITANSEIICNKKISFGTKCLLSWDILVMDTDAHPIKNENGNIINYDNIINIGSNVWIGCRTTILKGTVIPNNCIIGSSTFLNKSFNKENVIIAGQPARIVRKDIKWERGNF